MKMFIPVNRQTGVAYPAVSQEVKEKLESKPSTNVFRFEEVVEEKNKQETAKKPLKQD